MPATSGPTTAALPAKTRRRTRAVREDTALVSYIPTAAAPRPVLTDEGRKVVARMAAKARHRVIIADALGLTYNQLQTCLKNDPALEGVFAEGRGRLEDELASGLYEQARAGNITASIFLLKSMCGWRDTGVDTGRGAPQVAVQINLPGPLSPDDYARLIQVAPAACVEEAE